MRWVLIACLCLGVAFQGFARIPTGMWDCNPDAPPATAALDDEAGAPASHDACDCCNDAQTILKTGQFCKDQHDGGVIVLAVATPASRAVDPPATSAPVTASEAWRSAEPAPAWRPPAS